MGWVEHGEKVIMVGEITRLVEPHRLWCGGTISDVPYDRRVRECKRRGRLRSERQSLSFPSDFSIGLRLIPKIPLQHHQVHPPSLFQPPFLVFLKTKQKNIGLTVLGPCAPNEATSSSSGFAPPGAFFNLFIIYFYFYFQDVQIIITMIFN